jgi:hypothetical protein
MRKLNLKGAAAAAILTLAAIGVYASMAPGDSASGHGTIIVGNDSNGNSVRRQFSLTASRFDDGTVIGNAVLRNPAFPGENGQAYKLQVDITCMYVTGNIAIFGGTVKRSNDPNLLDPVFFSVQDNGEPGAGQDKISNVYFGGNPADCVTIPPGDLLLNTIDSGNIQVRNSTL